MMLGLRRFETSSGQEPHLTEKSARLRKLVYDQMEYIIG